MKLFFLAALSLLTLGVMAQQDKSKRPSPPATARATLKAGPTVTIDYSQPAVKGRTIGKDLEPMDGKVWRTGANEATVFSVDQDVKVEKQLLPAGKYALFTIKEGDEWTIIFNKTWQQWGAYGYKQADDALRVKVKNERSNPPAERLTFTVDDDGKVNMRWADLKMEFKVQSVND